MVLGIARPRLRSDGPRLFALRHAQVVTTPASDWPSRRGTVAFEASADVVGGFPGFADYGCLAQSALVRVTSNFLLVNEGAQPGFGVPIHWIEGTALIQEEGKEETALRVFFREYHTPRSFTLHFRFNRLMARGSRRAARAQHALRSIGVDDRFADAPPLQPNFSLPWEQTREIESENVIWNGRANAPVKVGADLSPSDVWLTTKSIIWGSGNGQGINRIPLTFLQDMVSTRLRDRLGTPVIYLAIGNDHTGRFELPFVFNLDATPDRNFRERGAFLVGLRSRGLPVGSPAASHHPWRGDDDPVPVDPETSDEDVSNTESTEVIDPAYEESMELLNPDDCSMPQFMKSGLTADISENGAAADHPIVAEPEIQDDPTERFSPVTTTEATCSNAESTNDTYADIVLAEWSGNDQASGAPSQDFQIAVAWHDKNDDYPPITKTVDSRLADDVIMIVVAETRAQVETPIDVLMRATSTGSADAWASIKHYEELAIGALSDALRAIGERVTGEPASPLAETSPSSWEQAQALAELASLYTAGLVTTHIAASRRERILALGEVCVRLRTLVELFDGAYLTTEELENRRTKLISKLSNSLVLAP